MMNALPIAAFAMAVPAAAMAAPVDACPYVREAFKWTAEALLAVRAGKDTANLTNYVADAAERAHDEMNADGWGEKSVLAMAGAFDFATASRDTGIDEAGATKLVAFADAIVPEALDVCGGDNVPAFVRPGVADTRACSQVVKALRSLERVLPTVAGKPGGLPAGMLYPAATEARKAANHAAASEWSEETVAALTEIGGTLEILAVSKSRPNPPEADRLGALAGPVADEGRDICGAYEFRDIPEGAGQ